jgi:hypothetical protein
MTRNSAVWRAEIENQFNSEAASEYIQMIEDFLHDDPANVVRQLTSELIISLRGTRSLALKAQEESSAEVKAAVLYKTTTANGESVVTLESFNQTLLDRIAEVRQLLDCLKFYSMALSEGDESPPLL